MGELKRELDDSRVSNVLAPRSPGLRGTWTLLPQEGEDVWVSLVMVTEERDAVRENVKECTKERDVFRREGGSCRIALRQCRPLAIRSSRC